MEALQTTLKQLSRKIDLPDENRHITEPQRQHAVGMLEQFTPMCSLILHVLVKDGESTNGGVDSSEFVQYIIATTVWAVTYC